MVGFPAAGAVLGPSLRFMTRVCFMHHFMLQVLFEDLRFKERPFEWVYEGLQPLELAHVLEARVGPSLTLAALWSCVAGACRLSHVIVPVPQGGPAAVFFLSAVSAGALLQCLRSPAAKTRLLCALH